MLEGLTATNGPTDIVEEIGKVTNVLIGAEMEMSVALTAPYLLPLGILKSKTALILK